jgi:hypothetical protein
MSMEEWRRTPRLGHLCKQWPVLAGICRLRQQPLATACEPPSLMEWPSLTGEWNRVHLRWRPQCSVVLGLVESSARHAAGVSENAGEARSLWKHPLASCFCRSVDWSTRLSRHHQPLALAVGSQGSLKYRYRWKRKCRRSKRGCGTAERDEVRRGGENNRVHGWEVQIYQAQL